MGRVFNVQDNSSLVIPCARMVSFGVSEDVSRSCVICYKFKNIFWWLFVGTVKAFILRCFRSIINVSVINFVKIRKRTC